MCIGAILSGPSALDGLAFLIAVRTCWVVMAIGVVSRL